MFAEPVSRLILMDERVVGVWGYSNAIYLAPKIAHVTDDGLISVFNRSLAGATGIGRGAACRGPGFGWTSPDREIKSQSQKCERIDLNLGGSLMLGCVIRSTYFGLILRLDLHVL